ALQNLSTFTASEWIKTTSLNSTAQTYLLQLGNYPNKGFILADNGPNSAQVFFEVLDGTYHTIYVPRASVNDGNWHLLTGTYDGTTQTFYLDGISQGSQTAGYVADNSDPFILASPSSGGGSVVYDDVRIYNRALSAADVYALYTQTACANGFGSP